ncbi:hypothetical protein LCGC14_2538560 [marine sediment metagenome]|uniref:Uncharacterized protein n=1 Tax=marine sediment metagenome TaxID=412755 RepID=A0A0F9ART6_9ZZZZ
MATEMPDTREMSDQQLVDSFGEYKESIKQLEKQCDYLKTAIKARCPEGPLEGKIFRAIVTNKVQFRFDTAAVQEEMGMEWYDERKKKIEFKQVDLSRKE